MAGALTFLMFAGIFALVLTGCMLLAARARRRGISGHLLGVVQEIYHPTAFESQHEVESQEERLATKPAPSDT
ncbi:hypothetical protein [Lysinibacter cavernae]|uniref:Uncharacterized protein n=1 Tax=Lysinibacter cavernae TaxID=1640652 RepID=A0A7X5R095_9MICO|nr:hypothetical protein [Lysinibacter cavernae]NIH53294.1 hypothetical protein [Lysinibacter cavernae]